ncbi:MAG TPA: hypothetical protein VMT57_07155 [Candidatus Thermoplasmatota archaeon]|nr:hypothetical protein [Candidatus Thermoplasmatota archaeon]
MRITIIQGKRHCCIGYFITLLLFSVLLIPCFIAQPPSQLLIGVYDSDTWDSLQNNTVFEGKSYNIAIETNDSIAFVVNVTIKISYEPSFNVTSSNETPFITIEAPFWNDFRTFVINATKPGYQSAELRLNVIKGALSIHTESSVKENQEFQVIVQDQDSQPVEGALVFFNPDGSTVSTVSTDTQGIAYLTAPTVADNKNLVLKTIKEGYTNSSASILVENVADVPVLGDVPFIQVIPILFAAVAVIFAIVYVRWRKRKQRDLPLPSGDQHAVIHEESGKNKSLSLAKGWDTTASSRRGEQGAMIFSSSDSKVEEIRLPLQEKKKETTVISADPPSDVPHSRSNKEEDEWFKGEEYMRYKLDEMTGTIDRKHEGKWFEGERNIESKVDEALKKQSKKKKTNNDFK